jgi:hypothetical protein
MRLQVQATVREKIRVFCGHDGLAQDFWNVVVGHDLPAFGRKFADHRAVAAEHLRDRARRVVIELGNLRKVVNERKQHAARRACDRCCQKQEDKTEALKPAPPFPGLLAHVINGLT